MKETILALQLRSMRDNLFFSGIPESTIDEPSKSVKDFMIKQLKLLSETINIITFHSDYCLAHQLLLTPAELCQI